MKKLFALTLVILALLPVVACADVDLSSMSYDELLSLNGKLFAEIISRPEFKEVTVPAGSYTVGEDIPSGVYSLELGKGSFGSMLLVNGFEKSHSVTAESPVGKIEFKDGDTVEISIGAIVFKPYVGLGF